MEFPVWDLGGINSGLLIAVVSVLHVFIAQFAVGGGIYLVWMEHKARRGDWNEHSASTLLWLEKHSRFFLLLTMVLGAISGVSIWFTISVVNPAGTATLIHNFVFFWAAEWAVFLVEVVSLLAYDRTWVWVRTGRMSPQKHLRLGLIYAVAGFLSLAIINGIVSFMLTPGTGVVTGHIWQAFFNPTYVPSLVFRLGVCLCLAGMFALLTAPGIPSPAARRIAIRVSALWVILPVTLLLVGGLWQLSALPPDRQAAILRHTKDIRPFLVAGIVILPIILLGGVLAFALGARFRKPVALLVLATGLSLVGSFEWVRETGRRPWLAETLIYSNGMSVAQAQKAAQNGLNCGWPAHTGTQIYAQQCQPCHGWNAPRLDLAPRVLRLTQEGLEAQLAGQGKRLDYMPPFAGNRADRQNLAKALRPEPDQHSTSPRETKSIVLPETAAPPIPPFDDSQNYVLIGAPLQGFYQNNAPDTAWTLQAEKDAESPISGGDPELHVQLIKRGPPSPQLVTDGIRVLWERADPSGQSLKNHRSGELKKPEDQQKNKSPNASHFQAIIPREDLAPNGLYPVLSLKAIDTSSGKTLAKSAVTLAMAPTFGCARCHENAGEAILEVHDRHQGTDLQKQYKQGKTVACKSCHTGAREGMGTQGLVPGTGLSLSAAIHGWHASYLSNRGADACTTCHISQGHKNSDAPQTLRPLLARDFHTEKGLTCTHCHGFMEDHALALLQAEQNAGQSMAESGIRAITPRAMQADKINARLPWVQEPDCIACHDFNTKPNAATASAFNHWTPLEEGKAGLFSAARDDMQAVRCLTCHGAPHALYPARNPLDDTQNSTRDNLPPLQYQKIAAPLGAKGNCQVCHGQSMDYFVHHPLPQAGS